MPKNRNLNDDHSENNLDNFTPDDLNFEEHEGEDDSWDEKLKQKINRQMNVRI